MPFAGNVKDAPWRFRFARRDLPMYWIFQTLSVHLVCTTFQAQATLHQLVRLSCIVILDKYLIRVDTDTHLMDNNQRLFIYKRKTMVKIKLRRMGAPKRPFYRIVVADSTTSRDGAFIEIIGQYNPLTAPETVVLKEEACVKWIKQGAQPTDTVKRIFTKAGIYDKVKA